MNEKSKNLSALLVVGAFVLMLVPVPSSAADAPGLLWEFAPGDEPRWTMLKLNAAQPGGKMRVDLTFTQLRCPMTWGFLVIEGTPENSQRLMGATFDFGLGRSGVEIQSAEPNTVSVSTMQYEGTERCPGGEGFTVNFNELPAGPFYLLEFTAGTPFRSLATLSSSAGGISVTDVSSGDRTFYVNTSGFNDAGSTHAAVHSPPVCAGPDPSQANFCNPCCHWVGDTLFGADVGLERRAELAFEHHPHFAMRVSSRVEVSNLSVLTPDARLIMPIAGNGVIVAGARVAISGGMIEAVGTGAEWPPGAYEFSLKLHANAHPETGASWHLFGVDYQFPEEQGAG